MEISASPERQIANDAVAITPDNAGTHECLGLYIGGAGDVSVITKRAFARDGASATPVVFEAVPAGAILPVSVHRVRSTGTTATKIVGLL